MIRRSIPLLFLVSFGLSACLISKGRAQDPAANNGQASAEASAPSPSAPANPEKSKKVWTNDDVKRAGSVSVIGDPRNQKYTMTKPPDPATVAKYKNDLQKLESQLNDVTKKLHEYQDFASGKAPAEGGNDLDHGYNRTPVGQQIAKLQDKKKQLEDQIDALYDAARKQGIESGQLK